MPPPDWYADTDPKAMAVFLDLQRKRTAAQKISDVFETTEMVLGFARADVRGKHRMNGQEAFTRILKVLDDLGIPYMVVGSLASSIHGLPRTTMDIDLVVRMRSHHVGGLVNSLKGEFYADEEIIRSALRHGRSFNVIHFATSYKFDFFLSSDDDFAIEQFRRRERRESPLGATVEVATAEDTILSKLLWYRAGGEVSARQWQDIYGIITVQRATLDREYLTKWADRLRIHDLLDRAMEEASADS